MSDSLLISLGSSLAWFAFALFLFALSFDWFRQRFTHRRRCPKCWYDLSQAPLINNTAADSAFSLPASSSSSSTSSSPIRSRTCPECGYTAKRERKLYKSRKHPFLAAGALLLLTAGYFIRVTPDMKARGLVAALPATALLVALPIVERSQIAIGRYGWYDETIGDDVWAELYERASKGKLVHWQYKWLVRICADILKSSSSADKIDQDDAKPMLANIYMGGYIDDPAILSLIANPAFTMTSRSDWPVNSTTYIRKVRVECWNCSDFRFRFLPKLPGAESFIVCESYLGATPRWLNDFRIGVLPQGTQNVAFDVVVEWNRNAHGDPYSNDPDWVEVKRVPWTASFRVAGDTSQYLTPVSLPRFENAIHDALTPLLRRHEPAALYLPLYKSDIKASLSATPPTILAADFTILSNTRPIAKSSGLWIMRGAVGIESTNFGPLQMRLDVTPLTANSDNDNSPARNPATLQLRIQSNTQLALRCPDLSVHQYWQGDITIPLKLVGSP